jgi:hypothetical protein
MCIGALNNACTVQSTDVTVDLLGAGDLVVTEFMQDPSTVSDSLGEWFEVYNNTGDTLNLNGLEISDAGTDSTSLTSDVTLAAGEYLVFGNNDDVTTNGGVTVDVLYSGITLGNVGDELILGYAGVTFDEIAWDDGATFPDANGLSASLDPSALDATDNDDGANWCEASSTYGDGDFGTPGSANDVCPSFTYTSADVQAIFDVECAGCHTGGSASGGLALDDVNTVVSVVDTGTGLSYIEPGDTAASYIWHKLNGTQTDVGGSGSDMPKGSSPMDAADLAIIETWILEGAPE